MFVFLRFFYVISLVICLGLAWFVGDMIKERTYDNFLKNARDGHRLAASQFIQYVWNPHYPAATAPNRIRAMLAFRDQAGAFFKGVSVTRITILDGRNNLITRNNTNEIIDDTETDILKTGLQLSSALVFHREISAVRIGVTNPETAVAYQSIYRIENPGYKPNSPACARNDVIPPPQCQRILAVIELVSDISAPVNDATTLQWAAMLSIGGIFILLLIILYFIASRAESIISRQHENNEELMEMAALAESKSKDKSDFLANISHELRTPLNAIIGFSEIIRADAMDKLSPEHRGYINDIHSSGTHLLTLINDILDFSKAEAGKLEIDHNTVNVSKLIINSMRLVIPRAEEAQVTLNQDLPDDAVECVTDGKKLKQVLLNLLSNAVKFTPAGGEVRVTMWQKITDMAVYIEVTDTGIGIAPKDIAKVMAPFGQVDSKLSRKYEGTGLGLPLSRKFIEIMGGTFEISSKVDVGTKIAIVLPASPQKAPSTPQQVEAGAQESSNVET